MIDTQNDFLDISLIRMQYGFLELRIQAKDVDTRLDFDEFLSDPLPGFIKTLHHLDTPDIYEWRTNEHFIFNFVKAPVDDTHINISITITYYRDDDNISINCCITKHRYREIIDALCSSILASPDYPYGYPMYDEGYEEDDSIFELSDEIFDSLPEKVKAEDTHQDLEFRIYAICKKHLGKKDSYGIEYYNDFTRMLRDKIAPTRWYPKG